MSLGNSHMLVDADNHFNMTDVGSLALQGDAMFENDPIGMPVNSVEPTSNTLPDSTQHQDRHRTDDGNIHSSTGAGAGPLPTGFRIQQVPNNGSTLTEFTKRRNWSQRVLEELKDLLYILTPDGRLLYISPSSKSITGYEQNDLNGKFISEYVHPDDSALFIREFNESIASGKPLRFFYRFKKPDSTFVILESHGHPHFSGEMANFAPSNAAAFCRGFFMMARPYPTRNVELLDSFLEHKIEHERLSRRIADLRREEQEENEVMARHASGSRPINQETCQTPSESRRGNSRDSGTPNSQSLGTSNQSNDYSAMPPPAKPSTSNTALTQANLSEVTSATRPDSITDKMARYSGATHIEGIEMLTGLRYSHGERSQGISTGDVSPALIRGDAGIAIPIDKDRNGNNGSASDKKKKQKIADEYVCTDCGTLDSPEWRKGPNGPKTLCNACGLRWAKKEKKRGSMSQSHPSRDVDVA